MNKRDFKYAVKLGCAFVAAAFVCMLLCGALAIWFLQQRPTASNAKLATRTPIVTTAEHKPELATACGTAEAQIRYWQSIGNAEEVRGWKSLRAEFC